MQHGPERNIRHLNLTDVRNRGGVPGGAHKPTERSYDRDGRVHQIEVREQWDRVSYLDISLNAHVHFNVIEPSFDCRCKFRKQRVFTSAKQCVSNAIEDSVHRVAVQHLRVRRERVQPNRPSPVNNKTPEIDADLAARKVHHHALICILQWRVEEHTLDLREQRLGIDRCVVQRGVDQR
ncbi:hypothetical protein GCM10009659_04890 [Leucobacter albus]